MHAFGQSFEVSNHLQQPAAGGACISLVSTTTAKTTTKTV